MRLKHENNKMEKICGRKEKSCFLSPKIFLLYNPNLNE
jgi:hypothetical protein